MSDKLPKNSSLLFDDKWLRYYHLPEGQDSVVEIEDVYGAEVVGDKGLASRKPGLRFKGKNLPFAISRTDNRTMQRLYGADPNNWLGKKIALFVTTTQNKGETVPCIRIRPQKPA